MNKRDKIVLQKIVEESAVLTQMLDGLDEFAFLANDEKMRATLYDAHQYLRVGKKTDG